MSRLPADCAVHGLETELAFDILNKRQAANGDRFRPAIVARSAAVFQRLLDPLAVGSLKISQIRKAAQRV
jgi:hypothetical protein